MRKLKVLAGVNALVVGVAILPAGVFSASLPPGPADAEVSSLSESLPSLEDLWGIEIQGVRLTAANYFVDFRFRVIDPERAAPLVTQNEKPYLIDQASNKILGVPSPPKVGPLRTKADPKADRVYFHLFNNPGQFVKSGNRVTVVIGDFRAEDLTVE